MWLEIAYGAFILGTYAYHRWVEDKPPAPKPEDVRLPRTDEGSPVPLVYGRCRVRSPILAFAGNLTLADPANPPSSGNAYRLDLMFVVGAPFFGGQISNIDVAFPFIVYFGDVKADVLITTPATGVFPANFVADHGISIGIAAATGELYPGSSTQNVGEASSGGTLTYGSMTTSGIDGLKIPGYRNLVCIAFVNPSPGSDGRPFGGLRMYQAQVPAISFEVKSLSTGTQSDLGHSLSDDADPAAVIYDLLTSPWGKLGLPTSKVDLPSFQAASLTLFNEQHGYSRSIEQPDDASNLIDDVLRQIDGVMYEEPTTGKLVLKLIRNDYDVNVLDSVTPDNARPAEGSWYSVSGWSETMNQVRVTWTNRASGYSQAVAIGQNGANVTDQGKLRTTEIAFVGCNDSGLADRIASRELAVVSKPIVKASVVCNRSFYLKRPGDVVKLTWPQLNISGMVMRVARVDLGQLHKGEIHLDLIRDVFDVTTGAFPYA